MAELQPVAQDGAYWIVRPFMGTWTAWRGISSFALFCRWRYSRSFWRLF